MKKMLIGLLVFIGVLSALMLLSILFFSWVTWELQTPGAWGFENRGFFGTLMILCAGSIVFFFWDDF